MKTDLFHNYHSHGAFHIIEFRLTTEAVEGTLKEQWSFRCKAAPGHWVAIDTAGPWAADEQGDCWAIFDKCSFRLTPMHKSKEWANRHYDDYTTRNEDRHSCVPSHIEHYGPHSVRKDKQAGYQA